jgi:hypothetical protein
VPPAPRAVLQIVAQSGQAGLHVADLAEGGDRAADGGIQIGLRAAPVRAEEPVRAIVGNRQRTDLDRTQGVPHLVERRADRAVDRELREVVLGQPEARRVRFPREHHHAIARHPPQLGQALGAIGPVVHGEHGQRRVEGPRAERQRGGRGLDHRGGAGGALADHLARGLDGDHAAVGGLVGASAGAHVHHGRGGAKGVDDRGGDARVGAAESAVADADRVVELRHVEPRRPLTLPSPPRPGRGFSIPPLPPRGEGRVRGGLSTGSGA